MDRGRAGGFVTDNNYSGIQIKKKMQREHLDRLEKIKNRKPGSSITLDNNPPVVIKAALSNPRKHANKDYFNFITDCENKSLLKRISTILTAPPKITDKEYKDMKKLCVTASRGLKAQYEQRLVAKKNKDFFDHLKNTKAYYRVKDWEKDYQKQLFNQRFMRQVKYRRPENFKDKFPAQPSKEELEQQKQKFKSSHIDRLREYKMKVGRVRKPNQGNVSPAGSTLSHSKTPLSSQDRGRSGGHDHPDPEDELFEDDDQQVKSSRRTPAQGEGDNPRVMFDMSSVTNNQPQENRVPLASTQRIVKVLKLNSVSNRRRNELRPDDPFVSKSAHSDVMEETLFLNASIDCFLINRDFLLVSVLCYLDDETLEVEAEISSAELAAFSTGDIQPTANLAFLSEVAQEVVDNVEVKVDPDGEARLVLNLFSDEIENENDSNTDVNKWNSMGASQLLNGEELSHILLPDKNERIFTAGIRINVAFLVHASHSIGNFGMLVDLAKRAQRVEEIFALITIYSTYEDQLEIVACTVTGTTELFKRGGRVRPAVPSNASLRLSVPLPSIVQADPDMIASFAENLSQNLKIEHDSKSGKNTLLLSNPAK